MSKNFGYILLHRSLLDWEWYNDPATRSLFIHCLMKANWKDKNYKGQIIKRGSFVTGREKLAREIGFPVQPTRTALANLQSTSELTIKTTSKGTVVTVVNYDLYQPATSESTSDQPAINQPPNQQSTSTNELNKYKELYAQFIEAYPRKENKTKARWVWESKVCSEELANEIIEHVQARAKNDPKWADPEYVPYPDTFLRDERWTDEYNVAHIAARKFSEKFLQGNIEKAKAQGAPVLVKDRTGADIWIFPDGVVRDMDGRKLA